MITAPITYTTAVGFTAVISGGTLNLQGTASLLGAGAVVASANALTVNQGAALTLDNSQGVNLYNRLANATTLALNGGTFNYISSASGLSEQNIGVVTLSSGNSTINLTQTSGGTTLLNSASLTRTAGATVDFVGTNNDIGTSGNQLLFATAPTLTGTANSGNTILPYAYVTNGLTSTSTDFATYGTGGGTLITNNGAYPPANSVLPGSPTTILAVPPASTLPRRAAYTN